MSEEMQIVASLEDLKEQIRKLSAEQAAAFGDAVFTGMTAEFARECGERFRKMHDLMEILTKRYEQSSEVREVAQRKATADSVEHLRSRANMR